MHSVFLMYVRLSIRLSIGRYYRRFDDRRFSARNGDDVPGGDRLQTGRVAPRGEVVQQFQTKASRSLGDRGRRDAGDQLLREAPARFVRNGSPGTSGAQERVKEEFSRKGKNKKKKEDLAKTRRTRERTSKRDLLVLN